MPKHLCRALLWVAVLGMMAVIFAFSAQPGVESDELTRIPAAPMTNAVSGLVGEMSEDETLELYNLVAGVIRKSAHFLEYALLGVLLCLLLRSYGLTWWLLPVLIGVLYAVGDEIHQTFVPNRRGMAVDVLLDALGIIFGVRLLLHIVKHRRKEHVQDQ